MTQELIPITSIAHIGQIANQYAAQSAFSDYQQRLADNTLRRQKDDLALFSQYLAVVGAPIDSDDLFSGPEAWADITHGIVDGFIRWQLQDGYAIGSINVRLATIKAYCKLAVRAGTLPKDNFALINLVIGYRHKEARNVDEKRKQRRKGHKKENPISIRKDQAAALKSQPDTPQGRRDALLMCLLLDHGLRCGEIAALTTQNLDLDMGKMIFYRRKVDKMQIHDLTPDTWTAARRYLEVCTPKGTLLAGSRKGGTMHGGMSERAITNRMRVLCQRIGINGASAHDGRHAWATFAIQGGTDIKSLQDAGGWSSPAMPLRYVDSSTVANKGVKLG